jgi:hypothetical protein
VPEFPPVVDPTFAEEDLNDVRNASPILGAAQWEQWTGGALWALAKCGTLILSGPSSGVAPDDEEDYRFYVWPRSQCAARLWCFTLDLANATEADRAASGQFQTPIGTVKLSWSIDPGSYRRPSTFRFIEQVASPTSDPGEITVRITNDASSASAIYVRAIACYEIRRVTLEDFGDLPSTLGGFRAFAPDPATVQTGAQIADSFDQSRSADGLMRLVMDPTMLMKEARRSCYISSYRPAGIVVGTSYEALFKYAVPVLGRARYLETQFHKIAVAVYGHGPAGSNVRVSAVKSGDTVTLNLPTSDDWVTGEIDIETEDMSTLDTDGGIRAGGREYLFAEAKQVGAGTALVRGFCAAEDE